MSELLGKETIDSFNTSETRGRELSHGLNYQKLGKELIQNISESPIHLVSFTGLCDVPAATVSLRRNQLALGWNKVFVGGDILFYNGCPAFKTGLSQTLQHYRGVLDSLAQQTVQQAGITAEFCDRMFTAFGAPRQILEAVFLESAQSATRYAGSSF